MSEQDPQQSQPEEFKRTVTSLMLDQHFNQCSIPAGNTQAKAHELLEANTRIVEDAYALDKSGFPEALEVRVGFTSAESHHPASNGLRFALAAPKTDPDKPRLIAFFSGDLAVQVATFEDRKGDRCNYIQIGQEITDAAIIMGTNDHSRLEYVYAIKALLSGDYSMEQLDLLSQVATDQLDKIDEAALHSERLGAIYRKLNEQLRRVEWTEAGTLLLADGEDTPPEVVTEGTFPDWNFSLPLEDGREVRIVLLQRCARQNRLGILALKGKSTNARNNDFVLAVKTAEDVAVPLYTFSHKNETVSSADMLPIGQVELNALQRLIETADSTDIATLGKELEYAKADYSAEKVKERLDAAEQQASEVKNPKVKKNYHEAYEHIATAQAALESLLGMPSSRFYLPQPATKQVCEKFMQAPYGAIDLGEELTKTMYLKGNVPTDFDHGLYRLIRVAKITRELRCAVTTSMYPTTKFVEQANIQEKVTAAIGNHQPKLDTLIARLDTLSRQKRKHTHHGVCSGYPTPAGEVDFHIDAEVSQKNGTYKLRMYLTPVGQEGKQEPMRRFDAEISRVRPNKVSDDNAEDLHDLLEAVR